MKEYALYGEEYLGDGVTGSVTIRTGTKKQCTETMNSLEGGGQYSEMWVDEHFDIMAKGKEMIGLVVSANERWKMNPTKVQCKNMMKLKKDDFDQVYFHVLYADLIAEAGNEVIVTEEGIRYLQSA